LNSSNVPLPEAVRTRNQDNLFLDTGQEGTVLSVLYAYGSPNHIHTTRTLPREYQPNRLQLA
jgi:hypothetical protein